MWVLQEVQSVPTLSRATGDPPASLHRSSVVCALRGLFCEVTGLAIGLDTWRIAL